MYFPHGETVTVIRNGGRDRFGDHQPVREFTVDGCGVNWNTSTESIYANKAVTRSETTTSNIIVYMPDGTDIRSTDRVRLPDGSEWAVNGRPARWHHPMNDWSPGIAVRLMEVTTNEV